MNTDDEEPAKSNIELGFIGRNIINDAIHPDEHKSITPGTFFSNIFDSLIKKISNL